MRKIPQLGTPNFKRTLVVPDVLIAQTLAFSGLKVDSSGRERKKKIKKLFKLG